MPFAEHVIHTARSCRRNYVALFCATGGLAQGQQAQLQIKVQDKGLICNTMGGFGTPPNQRVGEGGGLHSPATQ